MRPVQVFLVLLLAVSCGVDTAVVSEPAPDVKEEGDQDLVQGVDKSGLWLSREVTFCFVAPQYAKLPSDLKAQLTPSQVTSRWRTRQAEFRWAIERTWGPENIVRFKFQEGCRDGMVKVTYQQETRNPLTGNQPNGGNAGLGRVQALSYGVALSAHFLGNTWPFGHDTYHTFTAAHEAGHTLGFSHEQDRSDSLCTVAQDFHGAGITLTGYDASSIMNYCNAAQPTALSVKDKAGFRKAYSPPGSASECIDRGTTCAARVATGECETNPSGMLATCCASCAGLGASASAGGSAGGTCSNHHVHCEWWASTGECAANPGYMNTQCCGACSVCRDTNSQCAGWAARGECTANPGYMRINCCVSCSN